MRILFLCLVLLAAPFATSQVNALDFWVGDWQVVDTTPNAKNPPGTNSIKRVYGGKVIHESFKMGSFEGQSWSVFDPKSQSWKQTWVDNNGAYIAMSSRKVGNLLAIQTLPNPKAPLTASRMVFDKVSKDAFTWRWEATKDGGKTWTLSWRLQYARRAPKSSTMGASRRL